MTFEELGINQEINRAITELGFENPMPVQEKVIPLMLGNTNDIVALAQTGTGKTAAFGLPIIQEVDPYFAAPQAVILCPTRELCLQIAGDLKDFAKYMEDIKVLPVYGGSRIDAQIQALKKGVHIIVATPGRMIDLIERRAAKLSSVKRLVLDEADEMLNMGFLDSINTILASIPEERNTLLFSATMPTEIASIAKKYMRNAIEVTIGNRNSGAENVKHIAYTVHARDKYLALKRIADFNPDIYGIIFCRTKIETQEIAEKLIQDGYNAEALHGDLSQAQRDYVMQKFRIGHVSLLVATDVAARGLDVNNLTHVINYGLPDDQEVYTHRSGRTGRAGKTGTSVVITNLREKNQLRQIEKKLKKTFQLVQIPSGRAICEKQLYHLVDRMEKVEIDNSEIDSYLPVIYKKLEWLDKEEVIKRFVSLEFNRFIEYYRDAVDINVLENTDNSERGGRGNRGSRVNDANYTRLFINLGKMDGFFPSQLIELVNSNTQGMKVGIGRIDLMRSFSFFEVENRYANELIRILNKTKFKDRKINIGVAEEKPEETNQQSQRSRHIKENDFDQKSRSSNPNKDRYPKKNLNTKEEKTNRKSFPTTSDNFYKDSKKTKKRY